MRSSELSAKSRSGYSGDGLQRQPALSAESVQNTLHDVDSVVHAARTFVGKQPHLMSTDVSVVPNADVASAIRGPQLVDAPFSTV